MKRRAMALAVVGAIIAACSALPGSGPTVRFENGTNTPMAVHVNGGWFGTYAPDTTSEISLSGAQATYRLTVHTPGGDEVLVFAITGEEAASGAGNIVGAGLPCGSLRMSSGVPPEPPLAATEPQSDPCP